jgi:diguanylate cyclase (GGDEF)-like protein/PAS domain S-box-containing protein
MSTPIRILLVEDSEDDAELLLLELRDGGYEPTYERIDTAPALRAALARGGWDLVISDYSMPQFNALAALALLRESGLDLPFIIVSGAIGEGTAVSAMKAGAHDYIMKDNLARLLPAIERELREAAGRREHKRAAEALRESEERYALAARAANDGLWDWYLPDNTMYFSLRWKTMLGYEDHEISSSPDEWFSRVHQDDLGHMQARITAHLTGSTPHFEHEHRMWHKDGTYRWILSRGIAVQDVKGNVYRMAGSQTDITERKRAEEQLLYDAFHDTLTGLPNRAVLMERLEQAIARTTRRTTAFAVLFLDLDHFKIVNDSLGHRIGDQQLIAIARRLEACLRPGDTVARFGGDEFAVLLEDITDISDAIRLAQKLQIDLALPLYLDGHAVCTTASIGIALSTTGYDRPEDILRDADIAMYRAKALGRARHEIFDAAMHTRAVARLQLETDLRGAVERHEFRLYYQPIVSLVTGHIAGFEALIRWQHPERGLIAPVEFIPVAEETGMIGPIGRWVLHEACRQTRIWQERFHGDSPLSISVNLSGKQVMQPDLLKHIDRILQQTSFDARTLALEITESIMLENVTSTTTLLCGLKARHIQVHIDDFGTGYSSLSYLHRFPIDMLKIDCSFISRMGRHGEGLEIVRAIKTLAGNLKMDVTAEGVETTEQLAQLRALQCTYGQGYLFSQPLDSEEAEALIRAAPHW